MSVDRPQDDLARLRDADLTIVGRFGDASNATLLVHLGPGEPPAVGEIGDLGSDTWAVYKPVDGEAPLWDFPDGTLHKREVAAFLVDRALGWNMVPPTILREDGPAGVGSLQLFVPHDPDRHLFILLQEERPTDAVLRQVAQMVLFDAVIENADRKAGHVLAESTPRGDRLWLVDHGVAFHDEPHLRTVAWHLAGTPIPDDDRKVLLDLVAQLTPGQQLVEELKALLLPRELDAVRGRAMRLALPGARYPEPQTDRPMPWPPI